MEQRVYIELDKRKCHGDFADNVCITISHQTALEQVRDVSFLLAVVKSHAVYLLTQQCVLSEAKSSEESRKSTDLYLDFFRHGMSQTL